MHLGNPPTLYSMIMESPIIVVATIDNPEKYEYAGRYNPKTKDSVPVRTLKGYGIATLHIKEVLKGSLDGKSSITVRFSNLLCPAGPDYPDKRTVIAFLEKSSNAEVQYGTVNGLAGSKVMSSKEDLDAYRQKILSFLAFANDIDKKRAGNLFIGWLVSCTENKYTYWEGAFQLSPKGYFNNCTDCPKRGVYYKLLTPLQLSRLEDIFFSRKVQDRDDLLLISFVSKKSRQTLKAYLLNSLTDADYYLSSEIMEQYLEIEKNKKLELVYQKFDDSCYNCVDPILMEFKNKFRTIAELK